MLDFAWDFLGFFLIVYCAMCVWASEGMHKKTVGQQDVLLTLGTEDGLSYYFFFFSCWHCAVQIVASIELKHII